MASTRDRHRSGPGEWYLTKAEVSDVRVALRHPVRTWAEFPAEEQQALSLKLAQWLDPDVCVRRQAAWAAPE